MFHAENIAFPDTKSAVGTEEKPSHAEFNKCGKDKNEENNKKNPSVFFEDRQIVLMLQNRSPDKKEDEGTFKDSDK